MILLLSIFFNVKNNRRATKLYSLPRQDGLTGRPQFDTTEYERIGAGDQNPTLIASLFWNSTFGIYERYSKKSSRTSV